MNFQANLATLKNRFSALKQNHYRLSNKTNCNSKYFRGESIAKLEVKCTVKEDKSSQQQVPWLRKDQYIMQKIVNQKRSVFYAVFTVILATFNRHDHFKITVFFFCFQSSECQVKYRQRPVRATWIYVLNMSWKV